MIHILKTNHEARTEREIEDFFYVLQAVGQ